jgi:hypothetical protein
MKRLMYGLSNSILDIGLMEYPDLMLFCELELYDLAPDETTHYQFCNTLE